MTDDTTETTTRTAESTAEISLADALNEYAVTLNTDDPFAPLDDLDSFHDLFSNRRVVGLGEATHGTREFFRLKHRLIRFLVEELDFRIVGLEANFAETMAINEYVLYGEGTPVEALEATRFWVWQTEEVVALLEWLRSYNRDRPEDSRVTFYGFDAQFTRGPASALEDFLVRIDSDALEAVGDGLALLTDGLRYKDDLDTKLERSRPVIDELWDRFDHNEKRYTEVTSVSEFELAYQHLRTLEQAYVVNEKRHRDEDDGFARDEFMAENVSWILDYDDRDRMVLWGHNNHIRQGGEDDSPVLDDVQMGHHLKEAFGTDYYALGFDFGSGSFQAVTDSESSEESGITEFHVDPLSYDLIEKNAQEVSREQLAEPPLNEVLLGVPGDLIFLDFESIPTDSSLRDWLTQTHLCFSIGAIFGEDDLVYTHLPIRITCEFDGLLFVRETNRARHIDSE